MKEPSVLNSITERVHFTGIAAIERDEEHGGTADDREAQASALQPPGMRSARAE
jgi:hypothetical protein